MAVAELSEGALGQGLDLVARSVVSGGAALGLAQPSVVSGGAALGLAQPLIDEERHGPTGQPSGRRQTADEESARVG